MILRKPYAFLIRHFKMMHVILAGCLFYLIYKTSSMISYINVYINKTINVVGEDIVGSLFNSWIIALPILIIIFAAVLLTVMVVKDKPRLFYVFIIIAETAILLVYLYSHSTFSNMEKTIIDMRTIKMVRDLLLYSIIIQSVFSLLSVIRGVGFDIKKFNFGNDLQKIEISAEDNEEFEVALGFDLNDKKRSGKRALRYAKYWFKEHKPAVYSVGLIFFVVVTLWLSISYVISHKTYSEGKTLIMNGFSVKVNKSYIINSDVKGKNITGNEAYLIVVDLEVVCNEKEAKSLATGTVELDIAGDIFHHTAKYSYQLVDLGEVYNNQIIGQKKQRYLFVYEIPVKSSKSKMKVGFRDTNGNNTTYISLKPQKFSDKKSVKEYKLGDTLDFTGSSFGKTSLKVKSYNIRDRFTIKYHYCTNLNRCIESREHLTPDLFNSNYDKTLLMLEAELILDDDRITQQSKDLYNIIKVFGKIEYEIDGKIKYQNVYLGAVKSRKTNNKNVYFIEIFKEIENADKISLVFTIRDNEYRYNLK